ncbi:AMP-binding protein [Rhodococcus antarcticus]|uniref:AMP-binding protein n=1 Tax=Rhodococcus antarcticus TaxID=2987751 RepID=UPI00338EC022
MSPHRPALWFEGATTTHGELALRVRRAAAALDAPDVRRGDRVAWFGANHPAALETLSACAAVVDGGGTSTGSSVERALKTPQNMHSEACRTCTLTRWPPVSTCRALPTARSRP